MAGKGEHTVKKVDEQLSDISKLILRMGGLAEAQLASAVEALVKRDSELALKVRSADAQIDEIENQVDELTVRFLALQQPMASDLREVVGALKIASDLERIGDYAANIAKRVVALSQLPAIHHVGSLPRMARMVQDLIKETLDSYIARDAERASEIWRRDEEIDEMYTALFRELLTYMMEDPRNITSSTHLLFVAKNVERMGDHATNIAETVYYMVRGERMAGGRPKGDTSSFAVVEPAAGEE